MRYLFLTTSQPQRGIKGWIKGIKAFAVGLTGALEAIRFITQKAVQPSFYIFHPTRGFFIYVLFSLDRLLES